MNLMKPYYKMSKTSPPKQPSPKGPLTTPQASLPPRPSPPPSQQKVLQVIRSVRVLEVKINRQVGLYHVQVQVQTKVLGKILAKVLVQLLVKV